jgi:hypothetical protein
MVCLDNGSVSFVCKSTLSIGIIHPDVVLNVLCCGSVDVKALCLLSAVFLCSGPVCARTRFYIYVTGNT